MSGSEFIPLIVLGFMVVGVIVLIYFQIIRIQKGRLIQRNSDQVETFARSRIRFIESAADHVFAEIIKHRKEKIFFIEIPDFTFVVVQLDHNEFNLALLDSRYEWQDLSGEWVIDRAINCLGIDRELVKWRKRDYSKEIQKAGRHSFGDLLNEKRGKLESSQWFKLHFIQGSTYHGGSFKKYSANGSVGDFLDAVKRVEMRNLALLIKRIDDLHDSGESTQTNINGFYSKIILRPADRVCVVRGYKTVDIGEVEDLCKEVFKSIYSKEQILAAVREKMGDKSFYPVIPKTVGRYELIFVDSEIHEE